MPSCPACGIGILTEHADQHPTEWEGRTGTATIRYSVCSTCKCQIVDSQQATANKIAILDFRGSNGRA